MIYSSIFQTFLGLQWPVKIWLAIHPFAATKAYHISNSATEMAQLMVKDPELDGDYAGGQVDAFRHAFWMASLSQKMRTRKAVGLGTAYEKGNYSDYKKRRLEDGIIPDKETGDMDYRNNKLGAEIGKQHPSATQAELVLIIKQAVLDGKLWKLRKNNKGEFLDMYGQVISPIELKGKWETRKCLVPTNFTE